MMTSKAFTLFLPIYTLFHSIYTVSLSLFSISDSLNPNRGTNSFLNLPPYPPPVSVFFISSLWLPYSPNIYVCDASWMQVFDDRSEWLTWWMRPRFQQSTIINQHSNQQNSSSYSYHHIAIYLHATHTQPPAFYHPLARRSYSSWCSRAWLEMTVKVKTGREYEYCGKKVPSIALPHSSQWLNNNIVHSRLFG